MSLRNCQSGILGIHPRDNSLSSLETENAFISNARSQCQAVSQLSTERYTTADLVAQNITVTESFVFAAPIGGIFTSSGGNVANVPMGSWLLLSATELPLTEDPNNVSISLSGNSMSVPESGWYLVSIAATTDANDALDLGWSVNNGDPGFSLLTVASGPSTVLNTTTVLNLSANDSIRLAANGSVATTLTLSPARISIQYLGA